MHHLLLARRLDVITKLKRQGTEIAIQNTMGFRRKSVPAHQLRRVGEVRQGLRCCCMREDTIARRAGHCRGPARRRHTRHEQHEQLARARRELVEVRHLEAVRGVQKRKGVLHGVHDCSGGPRV